MPLLAYALVKVRERPMADDAHVSGRCVERLGDAQKDLLREVLRGGAVAEMAHAVGEDPRAETSADRLFGVLDPSSLIGNLIVGDVFHEHHVSVSGAFARNEKTACGEAVEW